jgi:light-regulated signal transduction histidine kinase (bacteriophytochrome)
VRRWLVHHAQPRPTPIELPEPSWALEAELARLAARAAELERENAALEAFAAVAAHELLAPLIMTEAYATLVAERLDASRHTASRRDLAVLSHDVARIRVLVETLLDDSRAGRRSPRHRRLDLERVARACLRSLAPEVEASGARVELAPLPRVIGDQRLISVVLTTLIATALSSGRHGGRVVVDGARQGGHWSICVQADGPMIASAARARHPRIAGGGLNICRHLVERHGGEIRVSATNRFYLTLPQRH